MRKRSTAKGVWLGLWLFAAWLPANSQTPAPAATPRLPAELFYDTAQFGSVELSPSGRWLALSASLADKRSGLVVFDLQTWKLLAVAAQYSDADVKSFSWVNDDRLVYSLVDRTRGSGDQPWNPGLFSVRRDGTETRTLVKMTEHFLVERPSVGREPLDARHGLLRTLDGDGDEVMVGEWRSRNGDFETVNAKRLNVVTGRAVSVSSGAPPHVEFWLFDPAGEPRVAVTHYQGRGAVHWRGAGDESWRELVSYAIGQAPFAAASIDSGGNLYVRVPEGEDGTASLRRFDFKTGMPETQALVRTPGFDMRGGIIAETAGGHALGVRVLTDAETTVWFDKRLAALQIEADKRLPGHVNHLTCRRCDKPDMTVVISSWSDRDPGQIWVLPGREGRMAQGRRPAQRHRSTADGDTRLRTHPRARRDGDSGLADLAARPARQAAAGGRPGPRRALGPGPRLGLGFGLSVPGFARLRRDRTGIPRQHRLRRQALPRRPEAMGAGDAGRRRRRAGLGGRQGPCRSGQGLHRRGQLRRLCHADGTGSRPDLYRCGVAWVAVTDPRLMFKWQVNSDVGTEVREYTYPQLIGDPVADAAMLDSVSPVLLAERIKAPLLLAFGGSDRRVPLVHGTRMRDALIAVGRPPEWVVYDDEGHGWLKVETRLDFAKRFEAFLDKNLR